MYKQSERENALKYFFHRAELLINFNSYSKITDIVIYACTYNFLTRCLIIRVNKNVRPQ